MFDRRALLTGLVSLPFAVSAACAQPGKRSTATAGLRTRPIAGIGPVPVVGIGTTGSYRNAQDEAQLTPLRDTMKRFVELGGQLYDTAPSYGRAEDVIGQLASELRLRDGLILATKVGANSKQEGAAQIEESFKKLRTNRIDLFQVHNLRDTDNQLATLRELKAQGKVRAIGITTSFDGQYAEFEAVMRRQPLDTIQVDYALDNRSAERILSLAQEKGIAPLINLPFGRGRLFQATANRPLPAWAKEIDAASWAQVFLKYILAHPSQPIVIPGTGQVRHIEDNMAAARGRLPDAAMRKLMEQFIDSL
jgi:aryl-alcohol dehydrogenase-like predicted oxidoreductase